MNRAERRRAKRDKDTKTPTYTFTQEQLDTYILNAIQDRLKQIKKEAAETATNQAMKLLFVLPAEVLMDHFWPKSYQKTYQNSVIYLPIIITNGRSENSIWTRW